MSLPRSVNAMAKTQFRPVEWQNHRSGLATGASDETWKVSSDSVVGYRVKDFTLTQHIELGSVPAQGTKQTYQVTGSLTLHGVTKTVTFKVTGLYTGSSAQVAGSIPITFADWSIPNPSFGPVSTEDHGVLEFALNFAHA